VAVLGSAWLCLATVWAATPAAPVVMLEQLVGTESDRGLTILIEASVPAPQFTCSFPSPGEVVLEIPGATSRLKSHYVFGDPIALEASTEVVTSSGGGLRIRLSLKKGALRVVEGATQGIRLQFAPDEGTHGVTSPVRGDEYSIGIGDKLEIGVFGHDDLNKVVEVRGDGTINYPLIGDLPVAGKSVSDVDAEITRVLGKDYLVDPQVSVDVKEYQSQWITVLGEVRTPGRYVLKRNMRLIDLFAEAGGVTKEAGSRMIVTRRAVGDKAPDQIVVDREKLFAGTSELTNLLLVHGDIVTVLEKDVFYIRGEVARPGSYFLENGMTLMKAISVAGGFTQFANRRDIEVIRADPSTGQKKVTVDLKAIENGKKEDLPLHSNDTIIVPRRIF